MTAREIFVIRARQQKQRNEVRQQLEIVAALEQEEARRREEARAIKKHKRRQQAEDAARQAPPGYLAIGQLASARDVTESAIYRALSVGNIESMKIGNYRFVNVASYDQWKADAMAYRREYAKRGGETMKANWTERLEIARSLAPDTPISITEFQRITGVSLSAVYRAIRLGKLETIKDGHSRYILPRAYEAYRESSKVNRGLAARRAIEARKRKCAERRKAA